MRRFVRIALGVLLVAALGWVSAPAAAAKLRLEVKGLEPGARFGSDQVFNSFGCTGRNQSPALKFSGVPAGTKSLAVTMHDPDAATQSGWWHWLVFDLPATTRRLAEGAVLPGDAKHGRNDFGVLAYGGPCPPVGDRAHRYRITLSALGVDALGADPAMASAALIDFLIGANAIARHTVVVRYGR